jgi:hypothetical protein
MVGSFNGAAGQRVALIWVFRSAWTHFVEDNEIKQID